MDLLLASCEPTQWTKLYGFKMPINTEGVNVGVPVPREPFSFGWDDSKFGVGDITGKSSIVLGQIEKVNYKIECRSRNKRMS